MQRVIHVITNSHTSNSIFLAITCLQRTGRHILSQETDDATVSNIGVYNYTFRFWKNFFPHTVYSNIPIHHPYRCCPNILLSAFLCCTHAELSTCRATHVTGANTLCWNTSHFLMNQILQQKNDKTFQMAFQCYFRFDCQFLNTSREAMRRPPIATSVNSSYTHILCTGVLTTAANNSNFCLLSDNIRCKFYIILNIIL